VETLQRKKGAKQSTREEGTNRGQRIQLQLHNVTLMVGRWHVGKEAVHGCV